MPIDRAAPSPIDAPLTLDEFARIIAARKGRKPRFWHRIGPGNSQMASGSSLCFRLDCTFFLDFS